MQKPMRPSQRLKYGVAEPLLRGYLKGLWKTSKINVTGNNTILELIKAKQPFIPCYWHQHNLMAAMYLLSLKEQGLKAGFLISPSKDGEVPAKIFRSWGATIIRGSSSRTGAHALRDLYQAIKNNGVSPANTPDGPRGPIFECKSGPLMLAQMANVPIVPIACTAKRYRQLKSWDRFMLPYWFNKITIAVGTVIEIEKKLTMNDIEPARLQLEQQLNHLTKTLNENER